MARNRRGATPRRTRSRPTTPDPPLEPTSRARRTTRATRRTRSSPAPKRQKKSNDDEASDGEEPAPTSKRQTRGNSRDASEEDEKEDSTDDEDPVSTSKRQTRRNSRDAATEDEKVEESSDEEEPATASKRQTRRSSRDASGEDDDANDDEKQEASGDDEKAPSVPTNKRRQSRRNSRDSASDDGKEDDGEIEASSGGDDKESLTASSSKRQSRRNSRESVGEHDKEESSGDDEKELAASPVSKRHTRRNSRDSIDEVVKEGSDDEEEKIEEASFADKEEAASAPSPKVQPGLLTSDKQTGTGGDEERANSERHPENGDKDADTEKDAKVDEPKDKLPLSRGKQDQGDDNGEVNSAVRETKEQMAKPTYSNTLPPKERDVNDVDRVKERDSEEPLSAAPSEAQPEDVVDDKATATSSTAGSDNAVPTDAIAVDEKKAFVDASIEQSQPAAEPLDFLAQLASLATRAESSSAVAKPDIATSDAPIKGAPASDEKLPESNSDVEVKSKEGKEPERAPTPSSPLNELLTSVDAPAPAKSSLIADTTDSNDIESKTDLPQEPAVENAPEEEIGVGEKHEVKQVPEATQPVGVSSLQHEPSQDIEPATAAPIDAVANDKPEVDISSNRPQQAVKPPVLTSGDATISTAVDATIPTADDASETPKIYGAELQESVTEKDATETGIAEATRVDDQPSITKDSNRPVVEVPLPASEPSAALKDDASDSNDTGNDNSHKKEQDKVIECLVLSTKAEEVISSPPDEGSNSNIAGAPQPETSPSPEPPIETERMAIELERKPEPDPDAGKDTIMSEATNAVKETGTEHASTQGGFDESTTAQGTETETPTLIHDAPVEKKRVQNGTGQSDKATIIEEPANEIDQTPQMRQPTLSDMKIKIFLAGSRVHRGQGAERLFASYWGALCRCFAMPVEVASGVKRHQHLNGTREVIQKFLTTKKLKRLHNVLILGLMSRCADENASAAEVVEHIPKQWKSRVRIVKRKQPVRTLSDEFETSIMHTYDPQANLWTASGTANNYGVNPLDEHLSLQLGRTAPPSGNSPPFPGALVVDPLVRKTAQRQGLRVSENAIWLVMVAMREYMKSVLQNTIVNMEAINEESNIHDASDLIRSIPPRTKERSSSTHGSNAWKSHDAALSRKRKCITALDVSSYLMASPVTRGRGFDRLAFEQCYMSAFDPLHTTSQVDYETVQRYLMSGIDTLSTAKRRRMEREASSFSPPAASSVHYRPSAPQDRQLGPVTTTNQRRSVPAPEVDSQTPQPKDSSSPKTEEDPPESSLRRSSSLRGMGRGAKNLAALKARANTSTSKNDDFNSQGDGAPTTAVAAAGQALLAQPSVVFQRNQSIAPKIVQVDPAFANVGKDSAETSKPVSASTPAGETNVPSKDSPAQNKSETSLSRRGGRGFGVKNLAMMKARSSTDDEADPKDGSAEVQTTDANGPTATSSAETVHEEVAKAPVATLGENETKTDPVADSTPTATANPVQVADSTATTNTDSTQSEEAPAKDGSAGAANAKPEVKEPQLAPATTPVEKTTSEAVPESKASCIPATDPNAAPGPKADCGPNQTLKMGAAPEAKVDSDVIVKPDVFPKPNNASDVIAEPEETPNSKVDTDLPVKPTNSSDKLKETPAEKVDPVATDQTKESLESKAKKVVASAEKPKEEASGSKDDACDATTSKEASGPTHTSKDASGPTGTPAATSPSVPPVSVTLTSQAQNTPSETAVYIAASQGGAANAPKIEISASQDGEGNAPKVEVPASQDGTANAPKVGVPASQAGTANAPNVEIPGSKDGAVNSPEIEAPASASQDGAANTPKVEVPAEDSAATTAKPAESSSQDAAQAVELPKEVEASDTKAPIDEKPSDPADKPSIDKKLPGPSEKSSIDKKSPDPADKTSSQHPEGRSDSAVTADLKEPATNKEDTKDPTKDVVAPTEQASATSSK